MLLVNGPAEEAKCEDLEKVVLGDDLEKFFRLELNCLLKRGKN